MAVKQSSRKPMCRTVSLLVVSIALNVVGSFASWIAVLHSSTDLSLERPATVIALFRKEGFIKLRILVHTVVEVLTGEDLPLLK